MGPTFGLVGTPHNSRVGGADRVLINAIIYVFMQIWWSGHKKKLWYLQYLCIMYECVRYGSLTPSEKGYGEMSFKQEKKLIKSMNFQWADLDPLFWKLGVHWTPAQSQPDRTLDFRINPYTYNSNSFLTAFTQNALIGLHTRDFVIQTEPFDTLKPRQNGSHFPDNIFDRIFLNENCFILIKISLKFVQLPRVQLTIFQHWFK